MPKEPSQSYKRLIRQGAYAAISVAMVLIVLKVYGAWKTGAVSLQASLIDSLSDALTSGLNFFAIRHALAPADDEHRFGHGKIEALSGLAQGTMIALTSLIVLVKSGQQILSPTPLAFNTLGMSIAAISLCLTLGLVWLQKYVVSKTHSVAIQADSIHYQGDILSYIALILVFALQRFWSIPRLDGFLGALIAVVTFWMTLAIFKSAFDILMDRELPTKDRRKIEALARSHPQVLGVQDLRTRSAGSNQFIQLSLNLPGHLSLSEAHHIAHAIEDKILLDFPDAEVLVHQNVEEHH